jgi:hypothetical protein
MQPKLRAAFSLLHLNALRVTRSAINATFSTLQRRLLSVDPWLPVDTQVWQQGGCSKHLWHLQQEEHMSLGLAGWLAGWFPGSLMYDSTDTLTE